MRSISRWRMNSGSLKQELEPVLQEVAHEPTALERYLQHLDPEQLTALKILLRDEPLDEEPALVDE